MRSTNAPGQPTVSPPARAATIHIDGLPHRIISWVRGQSSRNARTGHAHHAGRQRATMTAVAVMGTSHHRTAGSTVNAAKRGRAVGG